VAARPDTVYPDSFWRSLRHLNAFRLYLAVFFLLSVFFTDRLAWIGEAEKPWFLAVAVIYGMLTGLFFWLLRRRFPAFGQQLLLSTASDSICLIVMMHLAGGTQSGLGLLLLVFMAAAGLHARTQMMLLMPSAATLGLLLQQGITTWLEQTGGYGFLQVGLLAVALFVVAGLSHILARGALSETERADSKAREAANLEMINARVISDLPYGVVVVSGEGRLIQHNAQAQAWMGLAMRPDCAVAECAPDLDRRFRAWQRGEALAEQVIQAQGGQHFRLRFMELDPDRRQGAIMILENLSALEQEAQKLKLAALGRLTGNLAHEIRNPLSAINHAAQLLAEDLGKDAPHSRLTRIIEDNVSRLNRMVEDVLLLNRRDRAVRERVDLAGMLAEFVSQFRASEGLPEGVFGVDCAPGLAVVFDRTHLHQILWNLCRNAWRYCSQTPGSIQVNARSVDSQVWIEVYNDGQPIDETLRERLFEPFYTTDSRGTGLGLHIARELSKSNEAELTHVVTPSGTLFRLNCPATDSP